MFVFVEEILLFFVLSSFSASPLPPPDRVFKDVGRQSSDKIPFDRMGALIYFADKDCG